LAKLLGHGLELRSTPGKGSVFAVTVERGRQEDLAILDPVAEITASFDLTGRLALVVQSDLADREDLQELLTSWNCEVLLAASGAQMLACLGGLARPPDLIIAAGPAPAENGSADVEMLRNEFNADVPALLVSTATGPGVPAEDHNGVPVLRRPFRAGRLRTLINNLLHAPVARARRAS
jgi:CheY-like chemotaxis protein